MALLKECQQEVQTLPVQSIWQGHHEHRPPTRRSLHLDVSAVLEDEVFGDGEAEAGAGDFLGAGFVDAVEAAEDSVALFGRNAFAVVGYADDAVVRVT